MRRNLYVDIIGVRVNKVHDGSEGTVKMSTSLTNILPAHLSQGRISLSFIDSDHNYKCWQVYEIKIISFSLLFHPDCKLNPRDNISDKCFKYES